MGHTVYKYNILLNSTGVINTEGKLWKDQRRFIHTRLRHFGMSYIGSRKAQMESRIMREVEAFLCVLKAQKNEPTDLNSIFQISISNVICDIIMSVRFSHNDARFRRLMDLIEEGFKLFGTLSPVLFIPVLKYLPKLKDTRQKIIEVRYTFRKILIDKSLMYYILLQNREEMGVFLQETIDEHRRTFDSSHVRDLLDAYLLEIHKANEEGTGQDLFEGKDHGKLQKLQLYSCTP